MKTTKKHFKLFRDECKKLIDKFNLNKYSVCFEWKELKDANAGINADESGMTATIALNKEIAYGKSKDGTLYRELSLNDFIKRIALHECLHLLLWRLTTYGERRFIEHKYILEAEEEIIRKLEKIIK